jgi:hypothetical protein
MDVCVVLHVWTTAWNIRWHAEQKGLQQYKWIKGENPGIIKKKNPGRGMTFFSSAKCIDRPGAPPSHLFNGYRAYSGIMRSRRGVDLSPTSSAEVKNELSYTSVPPIRFHGAERHNFKFTKDVRSLWPWMCLLWAAVWPWVPTLITAYQTTRCHTLVQQMN